MTFDEIAAQDGVTDGAVWISVRAHADLMGLPMPAPEPVLSTVSAAGLARALGISEDAVGRLRTKGLLAGVPYGKLIRYSVEDVRAALTAVGWEPGKAICDPNGKRGATVLARRVERLAGVATCCACRQVLPLGSYPPSSLRRGIWICRGCRRPAKRATDARRRSSKRDTQIAQVDLRVVAERDGWECAICGGSVTRATWSLDHVIPLSKGGPHTYENVVLAHRSCNSKRGAGRFPVQASIAAGSP